MMRHAWLPIVLAALFGLRLPLCVAACVAAAPPGAVAVEAPCHGGDEPAPRPAPAEHECECDGLQLWVAKQDAQLASLPGLSAALATSLAPSAGLERVAPSGTRPAHALPPPDLLLRNATLLL